MAMREIVQTVRAAAVSEGAGVTVHRTVGTPACPHLDPFLMLDHFGSSDPDEYVAGFPDHPHRGFVTLTYMLDGHMLHRDSMGNEGDLRTGGAQWMRAGSGVIHSEMPRQSEGLMRGFQLWINLPASEKMSDPLYQEIAPQTVPQVEREGARVKVLAGEFGGLRGPIEDPHTGLQYLDVALDPGWAFRHALEGDLAVLLYVFEGDLRGAGRALPAHHLAVLGPGDSLEVQASGTGARFILVAGRPIGESIVQRGPFVMNTREEIEEALADYRDGRLVRRRAAVTGP